MKSKMFLWLFLLIIFFTPVSAKEEKYKIVSGDLETVGSEICFDTECFYVIENDENNVKLLTKYNLYVGGYSSNNFEWYPYGDEATGMQDSNMRGYIANEDFDINGVTPFSSDEEKGTNYSDYKGSIVERYVNNYKNKLEKKGIIINKARLISVDELLNPETFACDYWTECGDKYPWIYSTSYWTGSSVDEDAILFLSSFLGGYGYDQNTLFGVRPVIEVPVGYFSEKGIFNGPVLKVSNSDGVISNDDNSVDVIFNDLEQDVKYQTTIYNNTDKVLYVNDINLKNISEDFINARLDSKSSNMMVEPGGSSLITFYVRTLKEEGAGRNLNDNITINFRLSDKNLNPGTFSNIFEMLALIVILCGTIYFIKNNKSKKVKTLLFVGVVSILGINFVYADDFIDVSVSGKIKYLSQNNIVSSGTVLNGKVADYTNSKEVWAYYDKVKNVEVKSIIDKPKKYFKEFDLTENKTGRVVAYLIENGDKDIPYDLVIMSNGVVIANSDSSFMFSFPNTEKVDGLSNVDFRGATTMQGMFIGNEKLVSVDTKSIEMDNTTNTSFMFYQCDEIEHEEDDFNLENVDNKKYMFTPYLYKIVSKNAQVDTNVDFTKIVSETNGQGKNVRANTILDKYPIYYYRGNVDNNNVKFAGFCWKIVRTTDTGGTKLIYNGKIASDGSCQTTSYTIAFDQYNINSEVIGSGGYMYDDSFSYESASFSSIKTIVYSASHFLTSKYMYSDKVIYEDGFYTLVDPKETTLGEGYKDLIGKYTCSSYCKSPSYVIDIEDNVVHDYHVRDGYLIDDYYITVSKTIKENEDETYTLTSPIEIKITDWYKDYSKYEDYYICSDLTSTSCTEKYQIDSPQKTNLYLDKSLGFIYGNDVTYDNGVYTLVDTIKSEGWKSDSKKISNKYHYTCFNKFGKCNQVYYLLDIGDSSSYYILLDGGDVLTDIQNSIASNKINSNVKNIIDSWYESNLTAYTSKLEDTVWCNSKSIATGSLKGKDVNGDSEKSRYYEYFNLYQSPSNITLDCDNKSNSFTVSEKLGNGKLIYPVGMLTLSETTLAGHGIYASVQNTYLYNGSSFWLMTPYGYPYNQNIRFYRSGFQGTTSSSYSGIRPVISLNYNNEVVTGDGTVNNPYVIE